mgnify:CR=1 FL=1
MHALGKITPAKSSETDKPARPTPTYSQVFGQWLCDMAAADPLLCGITPAMGEGSGMQQFAADYPERFHDVAIAEQHAVTLAAGMACENVHPVVAIYSTFLQRAYDQLIHDVAITVGIFSIFGKEFTLPIIAALLTIIGYSLNDTIIVFDRIRENTKKLHKNPLAAIINRSINETLSRTLLTSLTTLVVVVTLFVLGGGIIHDFAFALLVGILIGTYSSVFVASPILLAWQGKSSAG